MFKYTVYFYNVSAEYWVLYSAEWSTEQRTKCCRVLKVVQCRVLSAVQSRVLSSVQSRVLSSVQSRILRLYRVYYWVWTVYGIEFGIE